MTITSLGRLADVSNWKEWPDSALISQKALSWESLYAAAKGTVKDLVALQVLPI